MAAYALQLFFEWRGGSLWCENEAARAAFDVGPVEDVVPISSETRRRLAELSAWHDTALDWNDPTGPSPWSTDERARFDAAAADILHRIRAELGHDFQVEYVDCES